ncbi:MAG: hypothetical protein IJT44_08380 [Clostridia bacterium]|nr:hypothetical protein [Clostridia bacterium]
MKNRIRAYFDTILHNVKKWELIYWWIMRGLMIFALIDTLVRGRDYNGSNPPVQIAANLVGMFAYEIIQLFPKKSRLRFFSPHFQNITALGFLLGSFGGAYLNLYYILPMYDKILHATGTAEGVYIGYEYVCATQLKLRKTCPPQIAVLCAMGFGFILASGWELFEFTYDQFFGGDAQHWNYLTALETAGGDWKNIFQMFPIRDYEVFKMRFALMDTMCDIVMNFVGGIIMYVILRIWPYRHRGDGDVNRRIELDEAAARAQTDCGAASEDVETVTRVTV